MGGKVERLSVTTSDKGDEGGSKVGVRDLDRVDVADLVGEAGKDHRLGGIVVRSRVCTPQGR